MNQNLCNQQNLNRSTEGRGTVTRLFSGYKTACTALILLCLVIAAAITGIRPAAAMEGSGEWEDPWQVTTWSELCETLQQGGYIELQNDVKFGEGGGAYESSPLQVSGSVSVTLDLNGFIIDRSGKNEEPVSDGNVIRIGAGTLTLKDSSASGDVPGIGLITGGNTSDYGGGVYVDSDGTFTMEGGTISGNTAEERGGGVHVAYGGSFILKRGAVSGNTAVYYAGGVFVDGSFTMEGGTISGNTAYNGGGVYVYNKGIFNMTGGMISGNTSKWGGGVYVDGSFTMEGGTISGNTAEERGGGVYSGGSFNISGNPVITGNKMEDGGFFYDDNVWLPGRNSSITVTGPLTNTIPIGVGADGGFRTFTSGLSGKGVTVNFRSDGYYLVGISGSEACLKNETDDRTIIFDSNGGTGRMNSQSGALNTEVTLNENSFTGTETFRGWNTLPNGTGTHYADGGKIILTGDVTLYAQWGNAAEIVGGEGYPTLQDAVNAAAEGDTVRLLTHIDSWELAGSWPLQISDDTNNRDVILDLNGFTIDRGLKNQEAEEDGYVILVGNGGGLTLMDSSTAKTGLITGGRNTGSGGGVYVGGRSSFRMYAGTISGNSAANGGGVYVDNDQTTVYIYGSRISDNSAANGGGVYIYGMDDPESNSRYYLEISNSTISGNSAENGGGVYIDNNAYFKMSESMIGGTTDQDINTASSGGGVYIGSGIFDMSSGTISGNTASEQGGGVYVGDTFKISGNSIIRWNMTGDINSNVWLSSGKTVRVSGELTNSAPIGVTMEDGSGTFTSGLGSKGTAADFVSDDGRAIDMDAYGELAIRADETDDFTITYAANGGTGEMDPETGTIGETAEIDSCSFSAEGRSCLGWNTRADRGGISYEPGQQITPEGNMTLYAQWEVAEVNGEKYMTLQGAVDGAGDGGTVKLLENIDSDAKVCDQQGESFGFPLLIGSGKRITLDLNGYSIDRGLEEETIYGYVVEISGTLTLTDSSASGDDPGRGRITGGYDNWYGGGVFINAGGSFTMKGGTITGNTAVVGGGGVYVSEMEGEKIASFNMEGGTISGNTAAAYGGGVAISGGSRFTMTGGTISGNRAESKGGGVYLDHGLDVDTDAVFTMEGGTVSGNYAKWGGGVGLSSGTFTMTGGTISGNTSNSMGGGVFAENYGEYKGTFIMSGDASITGNETIISYDGNGGGVYITNQCQFTMNGGSISGNKAYKGGGVYVYGRSDENSIFTMNAGTITQNTSAHGGGVYNRGQMEMKGGTISLNTSSVDEAYGNGGGIFAESGSAFIMSGGTVTENTASGTGGGIYLDTTAVMKVSGGPKITANVTGGTVAGGELSGGTANNLFLRNGKISVTGALSNTSPIGITMADPGVFTSGLPGNGTAGNFSSDNDRYAVRLTAGNEAELYIVEFNVTVTPSDRGTVTASPVSAYENEPVTLTVAPEQNYVLKPDGLKVSYTDGSGSHTVTVTADPGVDPVTGAGDWTFPMPAADVTVSAEFISTWTWLQLQLSSADSGSVIRLDRDIIWQQGDPAPLTLNRSGVELTLDLNGHTINRGLAEAVDEGNVLTIKAGSLTLKDSTASGDDPGTGLITGGKSASMGGGVYVDAGGSFILEDGTISGNEAAYGGGGAYVWGSFTMKGGTISGNSASEYGGGVYVIGSLNLSGDSLITGSTGRNGAADNVYLVSGAFITVTGPLTGADGSIGVTHWNGTGKIADGTTEYTLSDSDRAVFSSDDPAMGVFLKEDNAVYLLYPLSIAGVSAKGKVYDGTTAAEILGTPVLNGVLSEYPVTLVTDSAAAAFADADAGQGKTVSFSGYSLSGDHTDKYHLAQPPDVRADITQRPLTVTAESGQGKTFGAADPALTYTQEGLVGGDTISGTLARAEGEDAGTYAITQGTLSAGNNYAITYTGADFTISKAAARTLSDVTLSQYCNVTSVSASLSGKMPADAGTLSYTPGTPVISGSQKTGVSGFSVDENGALSASITDGEGNVTVTLPVVISSTNYEDSTGNVVVTLLPVYDVSVIPGANMTKTVDSGAERQTDLEGAMTPVVYTADEGYYFPEDYSVAPVNGISVTRDSWTQITVDGTPDDDTEISLTAASAKVKENTPSAVFTASGSDSGKLTKVSKGMKYSLDGGSSWQDISGTEITLASGVTAAKGIKVYQPASDANTRIDSDVQTITVTQAAVPTTPAAVGCTTDSNNDGKLTGVAKTMEYKKSDASSWTSGTGSVITGLVPGTYYVRVKAAGSVLASENLTLQIAAYKRPLATGVIIRDSSGTNITGKTVTVHTASTQLKGVVSPAEALQKVSWKSSDANTAAVDPNGKVTFKKAGTVTVTAAAADGSKKSASVKLTYVPLASGVIIQNASGTNITGKTVTLTSASYQLKGVVSPAAASQKVTWKSSGTNTATVDSNGKVTFRKSGTVTVTATAADGSRKSASVKLTYSAEPPVLEIRDSNVRGKNKEIQVLIPWSPDLTKVESVLYDDETGKKVSPLPAYKERMYANGKNMLISWVGDPLENGHVYRMEIRVYNGHWSNKVSKYGMPIPNVYGATVVAGNRTMIINTRHREPADGTRYMIYDADSGKEIAYKVGTKTNTTWTYGELQNGKLYFVVAVPYRDYKGQRLWGTNENRIYFLPMSIPGNGAVSFSGTNAKVTIGRDGSVDGIRVLYRPVGGAIVNGCEGAGNSCTVKGLKSTAAYEFYAMKYRTVDGRKYYSTGTLIPWNTGGSGLKAPQMNPTVAMSNSGNTVFTVKKAAEAEGLSVLYREGEGDFLQACEKAGNTCSAALDTKANYTFYIMQYRTVNGKKLYSPGIVARDYSSGKAGTGSASAAKGPEYGDLRSDDDPLPDVLDFYRLEETMKEYPVPGFDQ